MFMPIDPNVHVGEKYNRLTAIRPAYYDTSLKKPKWVYDWQCECGNTIQAKYSTVKSGAIKSCGCHIKESRRPYMKAGHEYHYIYVKYLLMVESCYNPKNQNYKNSGAKGIKICKEWYDPENPKDFDRIERYIKWALDNGWKDGMSIIRRNFDKDYTPENCEVVSSFEAHGHKTTSYHDHTGEKFGYWTVIGPNFKGANGLTQCLCRCKCGTERLVDWNRLHSGHSLSCGCYQLERVTYNGFTTKESNDRRLYRIYRGMIDRCYHGITESYKYYGAKGIEVCPEWYDPDDTEYKGAKAFIKWARENGYRDNLTIDRIDYTKDYCPENCRWVTTKEQARNRSNNCHICDGEDTLTYVDMEDKYSIPHGLISISIRSGWSKNAVIYSLKNQDKKIYRDATGTYYDFDGFKVLIPNYGNTKEEY